MPAAPALPRRRCPNGAVWRPLRQVGGVVVTTDGSGQPVVAAAQPGMGVKLIGMDGQIDTVKVRRDGEQKERASAHDRRERRQGGAR